MKRILAHLASVSLFLGVIGCANQYDIRVGKAIEHLQNEKKLNDNLEQPADAKSNLATANIYVRPPLGLKATQEFGVTLTDPDKFDLKDSFSSSSESGSQLHILARYDKPKVTPTKKGGKAAETKVVRNDFTADVIDMLKTVYGTDVKSKPKTESHSFDGKSNSFKMLDLQDAPKDVRVYIFGEKTSPTQVALIFEYPKGELKSQSSKIEYCLGSFRVGEAAHRLYSGQGEEGGEGEGAAPPTGVF